MRNRSLRTWKVLTSSFHQRQQSSSPQPGSGKMVLEDNQKIGIGLICLGLLFVVIGVILFLDAKYVQAWLVAAVDSSPFLSCLSSFIQADSHWKHSIYSGPLLCHWIQAYSQFVYKVGARHSFQCCTIDRV